MARRASIVTGVASAATRGALAAVPAQHQARPLGVGLFLVTGGAVRITAMACSMVAGA